MNKIFTELTRQLAQQRDVMLVTITAGGGSTPRGTGAQMLVNNEGILCGTVGGGSIEYRSIQMAQRLLPQKKSLQHHFILHKNAADDIGMVCGGEADMHFQYVDSSLAQWHTLSAAVLRMLQNKQNGWLVLHTDGAVPDVFDAFGQSVTGTAAALHSPCGFDPTRFAIPLPVHAHVYLFGGGHCAQALVPLLASVDFCVTVVENREEYARKELFPQAEQVIYTDYAQAARTLALSPADYVVVMTSGHTHDFVIQEQLLRRPLAYIGVIGSRSKKASVEQRLRACGISDEALLRVHSPIGLSIKAATPAEIAVSIAGEMIRERALRREATQPTAHICPMHE